MRDTSLVERLGQHLSPAAVQALSLAIELAQEQGLPLYLVGGSVRDLLLARGSLDLDLAVEGDAVALARRLAAATSSRVVAHLRFGTAEVKGPAFALDLVTARREVYPRPGCLPRVQPSTIQDDLARRDFTVNAMALALSGSRRGQLLDPWGGCQDLEQRLIRVLHDASFADDATRILRAVRYETRLGFRIELHTEALLRGHSGYLETISNARLRREFMLLLAEDEPERALLRCDELGILSAVHPALRFGEATASAFQRARQQVPAAELTNVYLALLAVGLTPDDAQGIAQRLALTRDQQRPFLAAARLPLLAPTLEQGAATPSAVVALLQPYPAASIWAWVLTAGQGPALAKAQRYLQEWRWIRPSLDGRALQHLGVPPGEALGWILRQLRAAKLDGQAPTLADEKALVERLRHRQSRQAVFVEQ